MGVRDTGETEARLDLYNGGVTRITGSPTINEDPLRPIVLFREPRVRMVPGTLR
jgi:hypothetical protein